MIVVLGVSQRQIPVITNCVELKIRREAWKNVYLAQSLCCREPSHPEEMHGDDMIQRALGLFQSKKRFICRQRGRKSLSQQAQSILYSTS